MEQKVAKEAKKAAPVRKPAGFVARRVEEDKAQVHHHEGVRVCSGCGTESRVQGFCAICSTMTCARCCRECPSKCERNG